MEELDTCRVKCLTKRRLRSILPLWDASLPTRVRLEYFFEYGLPGSMQSRCCCAEGLGDVVQFQFRLTESPSRQMNSMTSL